MFHILRQVFLKKTSDEKSDELKKESVFGNLT